MIKKLIIENYRCFPHFELDLSEKKTNKCAKKLAIIYGENGIGKSTIIRAINLLKESVLAQKQYLMLSQYLSSKEIDNNSLFQGDFKNYFMATLKKYQMNGLVCKDKYLGNDKPISITYEGFYKKGKPFVYKIVFNNESLIEESLLLNNEEIFSVNKRTKELNLNSNFFKSKEFVLRVNTSFQMQFGIYSLLSIIYCALEDTRKSFIKNYIANDVMLFIKAINSIEVHYNEMRDIESLSSNSSLLPDILEGEYKDSLEKRKNNTVRSLSLFFSKLYKDIDGVDYDIITNGNKQYYHLVFIKKIESGKKIRVRHENESRGRINLCEIYSYLVKAATQESLILVDEIEIGLSENIFKTIINALHNNESPIKGQLIITTQNSLAMDYSVKKNIYIVTRDDDNNYSSTSLDSNSKIQKKTDIAGKYKRGDLGGTNTSAELSLGEIINLIE